MKRFEVDIMKGENRACGLKDKKQKSNYLKKIGVFAWTAGSLVLTEKHPYKQCFPRESCCDGGRTSYHIIN